MKYTLVVLLTLAMAACTSKDENSDKALAKAKELESIVFGSKDSARLEPLFAQQITYGHSSGKLQNREEAVQGIIHNQSTYAVTKEEPWTVKSYGDSISVKHIYRANETKGDGTVAPLNIMIETVWVKDGETMKMIRRQATKAEN